MEARIQQLESLVEVLVAEKKRTGAGGGGDPHPGSGGGGGLNQQQQQTRQPPRQPHPYLHHMQGGGYPLPPNVQQHVGLPTNQQQQPVYPHQHQDNFHVGMNNSSTMSTPEFGLVTSATNSQQQQQLQKYQQQLQQLKKQHQQQDATTAAELKDLKAELAVLKAERNASEKENNSLKAELAQLSRRHASEMAQLDKRHKNDLEQTLEKALNLQQRRLMAEMTTRRLEGAAMAFMENNTNTTGHRDGGGGDNDGVKKEEEDDNGLSKIDVKKWAEDIKEESVPAAASTTAMSNKRKLASTIKREKGANQQQLDSIVNDSLSASFISGGGHSAASSSVFGGIAPTSTSRTPGQHRGPVSVSSAAATLLRNQRKSQENVNTTGGVGVVRTMNTSIGEEGLSAKRPRREERGGRRRGGSNKPRTPSLTAAERFHEGDEKSRHNTKNPPPDGPHNNHPFALEQLYHNTTPQLAASSSTKAKPISIADALAQKKKAATNATTTGAMATARSNQQHQSSTRRGDQVGVHRAVSGRGPGGSTSAAGASANMHPTLHNPDLVPRPVTLSTAARSINREDDGDDSQAPIQQKSSSHVDLPPRHPSGSAVLSTTSTAHHINTQQQQPPSLQQRHTHPLSGGGGVGGGGGGGAFGDRSATKNTFKREDGGIVSNTVSRSRSDFQSSRTTSKNPSPMPNHPLQGPDMPRNFVLTGIQGQMLNRVTAAINSLGNRATILDCPADAPPPREATHIVIPDRPRSVKALCGVVAGMYMCTPDYIFDCLGQGFWIDEEEENLMRSDCRALSGKRIVVNLEPGGIKDRLAQVVVFGGGTVVETGDTDIDFEITGGDQLLKLCMPDCYT